MISSVKQGFVASTATSVSGANKEAKTNETQKTANDKVSRIAEQIQKGEYKFDLNATAQAVADSLF